MRQVLDSSVTTTETLRRAMRRSRESRGASSGATAPIRKTIAKWKPPAAHRDLPEDPVRPASVAFLQIDDGHMLRARQIGARARLSSSGERVPRGKRATDSAIIPFSTRVKSCLCSRLVAPTAITRVMSVVPVWYWPPESISSRPLPVCWPSQITACDWLVAR